MTTNGRLLAATTMGDSLSAYAEPWPDGSPRYGDCVQLLNFDAHSVQEWSAHDACIAARAILAEFGDPAERMRYGG